MSSLCPNCHQPVDEDYICCAGIEFQWKCKSCHKRSLGFAIPFGRCPLCEGELASVSGDDEPSESRLIALQEAVQIEISSFHFYRRLAAAVEDPEVSDFFERFSEMEHEHATELMTKYHLHLGEEIFRDSNCRLPQPFFDDLSFFANTGDVNRLYNCAISLEKRTLQFFISKTESMPKGKEQELYQELAAEEREHIALLETERDRLKIT